MEKKNAFFYLIFMIDKVIRELIKETEQESPGILTLTHNRSSDYYENELKVNFVANKIEKTRLSLINSKITLEMLAANDQTNASIDCAHLIGQINCFMSAYDNFIKECELKLEEGSVQIQDMIKKLVNTHSSDLDTQDKIIIQTIVYEKQVSPRLNLVFLKKSNSNLMHTINSFVNAFLNKEEFFMECINDEINIIK